MDGYALLGHAKNLDIMTADISTIRKLSAELLNSLDSALPYPYVHVVAMISWFFMIQLVIVCAGMVGVGFYKEDNSYVLTGYMSLIFLSLVVMALANLYSMLSNPLGHGYSELFHSEAENPFSGIDGRINLGLRIGLGSRVEALYRGRDQKMAHGTIVSDRMDGTYDVNYDCGEKASHVRKEALRPLVFNEDVWDPVSETYIYRTDGEQNANRGAGVPSPSKKGSTKRRTEKGP
jgi:hypothetical protein